MSVDVAIVGFGLCRFGAGGLLNLKVRDIGHWSTA